MIEDNYKITIYWKHGFIEKYTTYLSLKNLPYEEHRLEKMWSVKKYKIEPIKGRK